MNTKEKEQYAGNLDAQIAYWGLPYALTSTIERILKENPIQRDFTGYFIELDNRYLFYNPCDLEEYLQWLEEAYPYRAKGIREKVREADEKWFGRNNEAM